MLEKACRSPDRFSLIPPFMEAWGEGFLISAGLDRLGADTPRRCPTFLASFPRYPDCGGVGGASGGFQIFLAL